jgi:hypothetical protein
MNKILSSFLLVLFVSISQAQLIPGKYKSISAHGFVAGLSNYSLELIQPQPYFGGGLSYSHSLTYDLNLFGGVSFIQHQLVYPKYAFEDCDSPDGKCWKESTTTNLHIPIGVGFYLNNNTLGLRSYYRLALMPSLSIQETMIQTETEFEPEFRHVDYVYEKNGLKFQDLYIRFALGTEIQLYKAFNLFLEPTLQHSLLFRSENVTSPNYILSFNIGFRFRLEEK